MPLSDINLVIPRDLVKDLHLLLHKCGPDDTRTVFDGKVGSVAGDGQYFIVSPNVDHTYALPLGKNREMQLRMDGRYADDNYLVGPQPYLVPFCHYAAVPRKPKDPFDALAIMWWVPTRDDFNLDGANIVASLGRIDPIKLGRLGGLVHSIQLEVREYKRDPKFPRAGRSPIIPLSTALHHAFAHLASLSATLWQAQFGVALLQHTFLELKAHLDYVYIFHPRMMGEQPAATKVADTIGAYVFDEVVIQEFVRAGLPVWTLKPYSCLPTTCIDSVVSPHPLNTWAVFEGAVPLYQPFFMGSTGVPEKYQAFGTWARQLVGYPNPFANPPGETTSLLSSSSNMATSTLGLICSIGISASSQPTPRGDRSRKNHPQPYPKHKPALQGVAPIVG